MRFLTELSKSLVVGVAIFLVFLIIRYFQGAEIAFNTALYLNFFGTLVYSVVLYLLNAYTFYYFYTKHEKDLFSRKHLLSGFVGSMCMTVAGIFVLRFFFSVVVAGQEIAYFLSNERLQYYYVTIIVSIVVLLIFYTVFYYKHRKETQVKEQKIIAGTASAQFDALKNQLDPHFLFNSLNVLTSLIEENPVQAQRFTTALSKVYRYVLEQKNKELVTVEEELAFAKTYMSLIKMRYEESIVFTMPQEVENPLAKIVPLSLQLLLENAVKHNRVTPSDKLFITIEQEGNALVVSNNLQPKAIIKKSSGVGLQNIKQRYGLLTERPVIISKDASKFRVSVPLLTAQINSGAKVSKVYLDEKRYAQAKEHVEKVKGFYGNLLAFCIVMPALTILNIWTGSFPWVIFPFAGWGLGLFFHAMEAFNWSPIWGKKWEERKLRELMEKDDLD